MMNLKKMAMKTMRPMKTDFCVRFRAIDDFLCVDVVDYTNISHEDKGSFRAIDDFLCVDVVDYTNISHEDKGKLK